MSRSLFTRLAIISFAMIVDVGRAIVVALDRVIDFVLSSITSAAKPLMAFDGQALVHAGDGSPIDPALQHGLRHEAGLWRRSSNRHI